MVRSLSDVLERSGRRRAPSEVASALRACILFGNVGSEMVGHAFIQEREGFVYLTYVDGTLYRLLTYGGRRRPEGRSFLPSRRPLFHISLLSSFLRPGHMSPSTASSSTSPRWLCAPDELKSTPSVRAGMLLEDELRGREEACSWAAAASTSVLKKSQQDFKAPIVLAWTACLIQRFYMKADMRTWAPEVSTRALADHPRV